ncbi:MAG: DUF4430 domain-containing protein [Thermoplasmatota archaeon]
MKPFMLAALMVAVALSGCVGDDVDALLKKKDDFEAKFKDLESRLNATDAFKDDLEELLDAPYAEALLVIEFGSQPGTIWHEQTVYANIGFLTTDTPTENDYQLAGVDNSVNFTAHDLLEVWTETGNTYNGTIGDFGFFLDDINGIAGFHHTNGTADVYDDDSGAFWKIYINGRAASAGASGIDVEDGMTIKFRYTTY